MNAGFEDGSGETEAAQNEGSDGSLTAGGVHEKAGRDRREGRTGRALR